ncbi:MAG: dihydroorotate dehydrogenase [Anaerolineaceae bacterium]|nr:dihydroorotate dehydrogenase [Anaerolineaceae bacterium]
MTLELDFFGKRMKSPFVLASGVLGTSAALLERCALAGAGAVTAKSCGPEARAGHANPIAVPWKDGFINAVGLTNPGAEEEVKVLQAARERLAKQGCLLFASVFAPTARQFGEAAKIVAEAEPDLIEVNISCPNVGSEFGTPFSGFPNTAAEVVRYVKQALEGTGLPISVKLSPNVAEIRSIARAVAAEGADAITAINTVPAMMIDAYAAKPILKNKTGGFSGAPVKPIALRCVYEIAQVVKLPIIAMGGVATGLDAAEFILAGATLVGVGAGVYHGGAEIFGTLNQQLQTYMAEMNYASLGAFRGKALP